MKNTEDLRKELKDYYGTAMFNGNPMAVMELSRVDNASDAELERLARQAGLDSGNPFGF